MRDFMSKNRAQSTIAKVLRDLGVIKHGGLHYASGDYNVQTMGVRLLCICISKDMEGQSRLDYIDNCSR